MKKIFIAIGLIILVVISIFAVTEFMDDKSTITNTNENETDVNVDGWLKITEIYEYNGRLAVVAENVSDVDVEYALLTVKNRNNSYTFNISALLRETKVVLICNEAVRFDSNEIYTGWKTENVVNFEKTPVMNNDKLEICVTDGSISIKNISGNDITSDILIYYKQKQDNLLNGSATHRIRVSGLKAGAQTYVKANSLNENNCQIIFTEYDDKKV
jgi:uncharacterized protein YpmS